MVVGTRAAKDNQQMTRAELLSGAVFQYREPTEKRYYPADPLQIVSDMHAAMRDMYADRALCDADIVVMCGPDTYRNFAALGGDMTNWRIIC